MVKGSRRRAAATLFCGALLVVACEPTEQELDLVMKLVSVPHSARPGDSFQVVTRVCNDGTDFWAAPTEVEHFIRQALVPGSPGDPFAGSRPVPPLGPGECDEQSHEVLVPPGLPEGAHQIYAEVDPHDVVGDPRPGNNAKRSAVIGIGDGPDLVVRGVTGPPSVMTDDSFVAQVDVCNQGTDWSQATDVVVYLSSDAVIEGVGQEPTGPDWPAGPIPVPSLQEGACVTVQGSVQSESVEGAYHLGAIVDESDAIAELLEFNNAHAAGLIGVGQGPDLVVTELEGPPSALNGGDLPVHAVVCNQGTASSFPAALSLYLSEDTKLTPYAADPTTPDSLIGNLSLPPLSAGECHVEDTTVQALAPFDGAWFLAGLVDEWNDVGELIETNNARVGPLLGVGLGADLVVKSLGAPPSVPSGDGFDVEVEVCNQGTDVAHPSELRVFLSADAVLDGMLPTGGPGPDPEVGSYPLSVLVPGECAEATVQANANVTVEGGWYLAAQADASDQLGELIETNNEKLGGPIGIGWDPDLVVTAIQAPFSAMLFDTFDATATVCNQGTQNSPHSSVTFYHSEDGTLTGGPPEGTDHYAGTASAPPLDPGACAEVEGSIAGSMTMEGGYRLGALVDEPEFVGELLEANNAFVGPLMAMGDGPDLVVTQLSGPPTAAPGDDIWIDFEVCNRGTTSSHVPTDVRFYASPDPVIDGSLEGGFDVDRFLDWASVPVLRDGECHAEQVQAHVPSDLLGVHTLGAFVDELDTVFEIIDTNNTRAGGLIGIGFDPDLVVTRLEAPPSALEGAAFPAEVEVCNQGNQVSSFSTVMVYLSEDAQVDGSYLVPGDPVVTDLPLPSIAPGACHVEPFDASAVVPQPGAWYFAAFVDEGGFVTELLEANNTFVGPLMGIGNGMDLVVTSLTAPASVMPGGSFTVSAEVCNQGTSASPDTDVSVYHSADTQLESGYANPSTPDVLAGVIPVPPLSPGACLPVGGSATATTPGDGAWYLGAIVDEGESLPELIETNNHWLGPLMGVGSDPDLVITSLSAPASVPLDTAYGVDFEVCNQGQAATPMTQLFVYQTPDTRIDGVYASSHPDPYQGTADVPPLMPGACFPGQVSAWAAGSGPQTGWLAATIDEGQGVPELIETNNELLGDAMELTPF